MAEFQSIDQSSGQLTQRFIEFVMMQAQQAALCMGKLKHPSTGEASINLPAAQMFIDHLELIREKTRGNLSKEEDEILNSIISELQITFVQVSKEAGAATNSSEETSTAKATEEKKVEEKATESTAADSENKEEENKEEENKKKFSKSYGA